MTLFPLKNQLLKKYPGYFLSHNVNPVYQAKRLSEKISGIKKCSKYLRWYQLVHITTQNLQPLLKRLETSINEQIN